MKKFLLMVLAVACVAAPAFAGDFAASGTYKLESIYYQEKFTPASTQYKTTGAWYQNDFEIITTITQGPVSVMVDWEPADFDATAPHVKAAGHVHTPVEWIDQYWITYKATDALTFKTGDYRLNWGGNIAIWNQGGYNLAVTYALDALDLGFTIGQVVDTTYAKTATETIDADETQYLVSAAFKKAGPFTKLNLYLLADMKDKGVNTGGANAKSTTMTMLAGEFAVPAGPVALAGEFGLFGGDYSANATSKFKAEGNYIFLTAGLKQLVGFDLNGVLFMSSNKMFSGLGENWSPFLIVLNDDLSVLDDPWNKATSKDSPATLTGWNNRNLTVFAVTGSYAVNDKLTLGGAIIPVINMTSKKLVDLKGVEIGEADKAALGTEFDFTYAYKLADNVALNGGVGMFSGNKDNFDEKITAIYNKLTLKF